MIDPAQQPLRQPASISIVVSNCRSITNKWEDLHLLATTKDPDVLLLSETHLKATSRTRWPKGYDLCRKDRAVGRGGGLATLTKKSLRAAEIQVPDLLSTTEAQAVQISTTSGQMTIINVYHPDGQEDIDPLLGNFAESHNLCIMCGDLNAKDDTWSSNARTNRAGESVIEWLDNTSLAVMNNPFIPTHTPDQQGLQSSVIDLVIATPAAAAVMDEPDIADPLGTSDHATVCINATTTPVVHQRPRPPTFKWKEADWQEYTNLLHQELDQLHLPQPPTTRDVDRAINHLEVVIRSARDNAVPTTQPKQGPRQMYRPSRELMDLIRQRRAVRRTYQRTRLPEHRALRNLLQRQIKDKYNEEKRDQWHRHVSTLGRHDVSKVWKTLRAMERNGKDPLKPAILLIADAQTGQAKTVTDDQGRADAFADHMERIYQTGESPHFDEQWRLHVEHQVQRNPLAFSSPGVPTPMQLAEITEQEVRAAIKSFGNKAPGPDQINYILLRRAPPALDATLANIFNGCLRIGYQPDRWKEGVMVMIPKPDKDRRVPGNHRPITLQCTMGKVFERVIIGRCFELLDQHCPLRDDQSAYIKGRSTSDHLFRFGQDVAETRIIKRKNTHMYAVLTDVEKAFDGVWHDGLRFKLATEFRAAMPMTLIRWLSSYLDNRTIRIREGQALSRPIIQRCGVPQGGIISTLLYIMYTNGMPVGDEHVKVSNYADDVTLWSRGGYHALMRLQDKVTSLAEYCDKWRIKLSERKTVKFVVSRHPQMLQSVENHDVSIQLHGQELHQEQRVKFLGVTFDHSGTFHAHLNNQAVKGRRRNNLVKRLGGTTWGLDPQTRLNIYKQFTRPVLEYGAVAWRGAAATNIEKLERIQRSAIKQAIGVPRYTPTEWLHQLTGIPSIADRTKSLNQRYFQKIRDNPERVPLTAARLQEAENLRLPQRRRPWTTPYHASQ